MSPSSGLNFNNSSRQQNSQLTKFSFPNTSRAIEDDQCFSTYKNPRWLNEGHKEVDKTAKRRLSHMSNYGQKQQ